MYLLLEKGVFCPLVASNFLILDPFSRSMVAEAIIMVVIIMVPALAPMQVNTQP